MHLLRIARGTKNRGRSGTPLERSLRCVIGLGCYRFSLLPTHYAFIGALLLTEWSFASYARCCLHVLPVLQITIERTLGPVAAVSPPNTLTPTEEEVVLLAKFNLNAMKMP